MDKKKILLQVRRYALFAFCIISAVFNVMNYVKMNHLEGIGTPYEWENGANSTIENDPEIKTGEKDTEESTNAAAQSGQTASKIEDGKSSFSAEMKSDEENEEFTDSSGKININTATVDELQQLSGIGEAKAKAIAEYRTAYGEFTCIEELMEVKGIGEGIFSKICDDVTVE